MAFVLGALLTFGIAFFGGATLQASRLEHSWVYGIVGVAFLGLAVLDVVAIKKKTHCPLGWRRQAPKDLIRKYPIATVAAAWGFDAGLTFTTFRVAALTWGALLFAAFGLSVWWVGVGYGLGFAIPWLIMVCRQPPNPAKQIHAKFKMRGTAQLISAVLLLTSALVLLSEFFP
jgi:hypothetical protein